MPENNNTDPLDTLRAFVAALDADDYIGNGAYKNRKIAERVRVMLDSLPAGADPSENAFDYYMTRSREMRAEAANAWLVGENARLTNELRELHNRVAAMLDSAGED
jgi:hypothetical protein